ncbi:MAG: ferritin-like domain-containing protein [Parvularculaceae bacterium]
MLESAARRFLDIIASIYIYNEHRGYSSIDRVLEAVYARCARETEFIAAVEKHRRDERKHYLMFRHYFEQRGYMPYAVDQTCGHIDRLVSLTFGCAVDELDTAAVIADDAQFFKLCRIIMLTEMRGMRQLDVLLGNPLLKTDRRLMRIFELIRKDEPSHWMPYRDWLQHHGGEQAKFVERAADFLVHKTLVFAKVPSLYLDPRLPRRTAWSDPADPPGPLLDAA